MWIQVDELKHGGRDIQVNNSNRIEYIHLMADYRLNRQVHSACTVDYFSDTPFLLPFCLMYW